MTPSTRPVYSQCGVRFRSELELPLPTAGADGWDVDVVVGPDLDDSGELPPPGSLVASLVVRETTWYAATSTPAGYRMRFRNSGEFEISADLSRVVVRKNPTGTTTQLLPILLAGTVSAFVLAVRGATVLHASAVAIDGAAIAFVGQSGRGKSTLAALLCVDGDELGVELVADDLLAVEVEPLVRCTGGALELRLRAAAADIARSRPAAATRTTADERSALAVTAAPLGPLPLAAIVIPFPSRTASDVAIEPVEPSAALTALLSFPRIHGWRSPAVLTRDFTTLSQLVNLVPVYAATVPWGPPFSPQVAPALARLATGEHAAALPARPAK